MGRTPRIAENRRDQILDAALRVFADKGFDRATNKDIAREAGITPGLIYHYFKSKKELLQEAIEKHSPLKVIRSLTPAMLATPPESLLRNVLRELLVVLEDDRFASLMKVFLPEAIRNTLLAPMVFSAMEESVSLLQEYLTKKMEAGQLRSADARLVTNLLLGGLMDLVLRRRIIKDPTVIAYSQEQIVETVVSTTLQGLLPR